jgi:hypothetical protein
MGLKAAVEAMETYPEPRLVSRPLGRSPTGKGFRRHKFLEMP